MAARRSKPKYYSKVMAEAAQLGISINAVIQVRQELEHYGYNRDFVYHHVMPRDWHNDPSLPQMQEITLELYRA